MTNEQALRNLDKISRDIDIAHDSGSITSEQYKELKEKAKGAVHNHFFALLAQFTNSK